MTQFEQAMKEVEEGKLVPPHVSTGTGTVDYFWFQLCNHHFYMKLFAKGMKARGINLKSLKEYYGLRGRSANDCLVQFERIIDDYREKKDNERKALLN